MESQAAKPAKRKRVLEGDRLLFTESCIPGEAYRVEPEFPNRGVFVADESDTQSFSALEARISS